MATAVRSGMRLGIIEPHLGCFGGIRRMIEFANRLSARGHDVTFFLPDGSDLSCNWMRCDARIAPMTSGFDTPLDVVIFNSEPQWHLLDRFEAARRRVFYALHYACLYDKEGSWECLRTPVDLQLANSNWTADQILNETGYRPVVQLGGVNRETFRPASMKRNIPLLTNGEKHRSWKGTDTVLEAARLANVHLSTYAGKNLDQSELGRRYARAQVFAVGSWFEGFCQPGLEALACGTPLVTTDNGGCREYARDEETALVVAPRDAAGMADAIRRLRDDASFARQLTANGLDLVARDFDWEARTDEFASVLDGVVAGKAAAPPTAPSRSEKPALSIIVQGSDDLRQTQLFMESVRRATDVPYDVVLVDSSTGWEAQNYARGAADRVVRADAAAGYSNAMNAGAAAATAPLLAFCSTSTVFTPGWARRVVAAIRSHKRAAIVIPERANDENSALPPFSEAPQRELYVVRADAFQEVGPWNDTYETATIAQLELCFASWVHDLDVVAVPDVTKPVRRSIDEPRARITVDRKRFVDTWTSGRVGAGAESKRRIRNFDVARGTVVWIDRYWRLGDREYARSTKLFRRNSAIRRKAEEYAHRVWRRVRTKLPSSVADRLGEVARKL